MIRVLSIAILLLLVGGPMFSQKKKKKRKDKTEFVQVDQRIILKLLFDGERQELLENPTKAASYYRDCISIDPNNSVCLFKLASVYNATGSFSASVNLINKAIEIDPTNKWYLMLLSHNYLALGDVDNAIDAIERTIELDPDKSKYQLELAELYAQKEDFKKAISMLDEFENEYGITPEINIRKQSFYVQNGQTNKAIETCEVLINSFPQEPNYYGLLAELYIDQNDKENALKAYLKLIELEPNNGLAHYSLANFYQENDELDKAEEELYLAVKSKDLEYEIKLKIMAYYAEMLYNNAEEWPHIQKLLIGFEEANPNNAQTYAIISDFYYEVGETEKARSYNYKSLEIKKDKFQIWNQLIIMDSELQDWNAMVIDAKNALELFPSNPAFYYFLGIAYIQIEEYENAIEILEAGKIMIFKNEKGLVDFHTLLGDAYNSAGNYEKSGEYYDKVLKTDPDNVYVLNNYAYYLSLRKEDLEKAKKMAKRTVDLMPSQYNYQDTYGWVLFQNEDYTDAVFWLEKAVSNGGVVNGEILEHYGDALFMVGKKENALEIWKMAKSVGDASDLIDQKIEEQIIPITN